MTSDLEPRFGVKDVLSAMRKVVEGREDFIYRAPRDDKPCVYAVNGNPSCLIGHVINVLAPDEFARLAAVEAECGTESADVLHLRGKYIAEDFWSDEAAAVADIAQDIQDNCSPWGDALAEAEARAQDLIGGPVE